ncbi:MAG: hypothetical protein SF028_05895 [Candidatus Sumerlaeia bacterium]|nr:hypothetical protein [Candidatus Sumerlaeia bacterium]
MKPPVSLRTSKRPQKHRGEAMLIALGFIFVVGFILATMVNTATHQLRQTHRKQVVDGSLTAAKNAIAAMGENVVWIVNNRPPQLNGAIDAINTFVRSIKAPPTPGVEIVSSYVTDWGSAENDFEWNEITDPNDYWYGYTTTRLDYQIVAMAKDTTAAPLAAQGFPGVAMRRRVTIDYVPMWAYWALTGSREDPFELHPGPDMEVRGRVHSNADMRLAANTGLAIWGEVTSVGRFYTGAGENWNRSGDVKIATRAQMDATRAGNPASKGSLPGIKGASSMSDHAAPGLGGNWLDSFDPQWVQRATSRWGGTVKDAAMGISPINPPLPETSNPYTMIERVKADDSEAVKAIKFEQNADLKIYGDPAANPDTWYAVDFNGNQLPLTYRVQTGTVNGQPVYETRSVARATTFTDRRDNKTVKTLSIDMGNLVQWQTAQDLNGNPRNFIFNTGIIYASTLNNNDTGPTMNSVQLVNSSKVPNSFGNKGMTLATDRPVYTVGNINTTDKKTFLIAGDAVTVLSKEFDANTGNNTPVSVDTTTNMVLLFGTTHTDPKNKQDPNSYVTTAATNQLSGGLHNSMRYLESWGSRQHFHNGSLLILFRSKVANRPWGLSYYSPPVRRYTWDSTLATNEPPPGMPTFIFVQEGDWEMIEPSQVAGYTP